MSDLFMLYEENLNRIVKKVENVLNTFNNLSKDKSESTMKETENSVKELERIIKQMELESSSLNKSNNPLSSKVKNYKINFDVLRRNFLKLQDNYNTKKSQESLLGTEEDVGSPNQSNIQKQKLIENESLAWKQNHKIENAKRQVIEMEHTSIKIMEGLDHNNNSLKGINSKVNGLNDQLEDSSSIMGRMLKKENRNKLIIAAFTFFIVSAFIIIVFFKLS